MHSIIRKIPYLLTLLILLSVLGGCSEETDSPEEQVRALINRAETAAEDRDTNALGEMLADQYKDEFKNNRRTIKNTLRLQFLRHKSVHLLIQIKSLRIPEPGKAKAELLVAMAGRPVPDVEALIDLKVDLYRFEIEFLEVEEASWKVARAKWTRATMEDFL